MAAVAASVEAEFLPQEKAKKVDLMAASSSIEPAMQSDAPHCPICQQATSFSVDNRYRPFCSARCQMIDLGNWLGERYVVPGSTVEREEDEPKAGPLPSVSDEP